MKIIVVRVLPYVVSQLHVVVPSDVERHAVEGAEVRWVTTLPLFNDLVEACATTENR